MKELRKLLLDLVPVLFGVLLALIINSYREGIREDKVRLNNIAQISNRIVQNISQLERVIESHELLAKVIMSTKDEEISLMQLLSKVDGFKVATVRSISGAFISSRPEDFKLSLEIEDVITQKGMMKVSEAKLSDSFYENINESSWKVREKIYFQTQALLHLERELLEEYQELLTYLNAEKAGQ